VCVLTFVGDQQNIVFAINAGKVALKSSDGNMITFSSQILSELQAKFSIPSNQGVTRKNAIVEYLDYQIPFTQLYGDMQAAKRD